MVTREDSIEQSVQDFAKELLRTRGYLEMIDFKDSFPYGTVKLTRPIIAAGFNADDEGEQAEMGSALTRRVYTIEFFVIGTSMSWARNVANVLKFGLESAGGGNGLIPLLDYSEEAKPEIDVLVVDGVRADRQIVPDPEPWQEFIWLTTLRVEDVYYSNLAA